MSKTNMRMTKRVVVVRLQDTGKETLGQLFVFDGLKEVFQCVTLEPPWKNNQRNISCIPSGEYILTFRKSPKHRDHFLVTDVPNRSYILIHAGNFRRNTEGCILVGRGFRNLDTDDQMDVTSSRATLNRLLKVLPHSARLSVVRM